LNLKYENKNHISVYDCIGCHGNHYSVRVDPVMSDDLQFGLNSHYFACGDEGKRVYLDLNDVKAPTTQATPETTQHDIIDFLNRFSGTRDQTVKLWYVNDNGLVRKEFTVNKDGDADWRIDKHKENYRIINDIGSLFEAKNFFFTFDDAHRYALINYNHLFEEQSIILPTEVTI